MIQPAAEQLLNLADRAERHGLTPEEAQRLRDGVAHHCARAEQAEAALATFKDRVQAVTDEARGGIRQQLGDALAALDEQQEQPPAAELEPVCNCTWAGLELRRCPVHEPTT